jgi:hypothetical protein
MSHKKKIGEKKVGVGFILGLNISYVLFLQPFGTPSQMELVSKVIAAVPDLGKTAKAEGFRKYLQKSSIRDGLSSTM